MESKPNQRAVRYLGTAPEKAWADAAGADGGATFFHTPEWAGLMAHAFPGRVSPMPQFFELSDGARAVLPLYRVTRHLGLNRSLFSCFPGVYGGPVCERVLEKGEILQINEWLAGQRWMRLFSCSPPERPNPVPADGERIEMSTHRIALASDGFEMGQMSHGKIYSLKRARREGFRVFIAEEVSWWEKYVEAYRESLTRWKGPTRLVYPRSLFLRMAEKKIPGIALWVAAREEELAAGAVILSHNRHIVTWHEASKDRYLRSGVNDLLHFEILDSAARQGFPFFDFNPSGGHSGVEAYKESFGAERIPLEAWRKEPGILRLLRHGRGRADAKKTRPRI